MSLPREARDGRSRVWLEILKERHPDTSWVLMNDRQELEQEQVPHVHKDVPVATQLTNKPCRARERAGPNRSGVVLLRARLSYVLDSLRGEGF